MQTFSNSSFLFPPPLPQMGFAYSPLFLFFFLSPLTLVNGISGSINNPIKRDLYRSSADMLEQIKALAHRHPDKLSVKTIKAENGVTEQRSQWLRIAGVRNKLTRSQSFGFFSFGQHGRELITTELALKILSILSEEQLLPNKDAISLNSTLDNLVLKVVPMENLNGRKLVEEGDLCERRNGRGVDLNRNWSVDWGKKEKDYDPYEENPGTAPFSEPESQIMRNLALSFKPHMWINVHCGMEALFMPYYHKNTNPMGPASHQIRSLLSRVNQIHCQSRCMTGSGGGSVGYLAHGTATDFKYEVVKVPMAFTFEIRGDATASSKDCYRMFDPVDLTTYNRVLDEWPAAFLTMFRLGRTLLGGNHTKASATGPDKCVSMDDYLDGYLWCVWHPGNPSIGLRLIG